MITGNDDISLKVILGLKGGKTISQVSIEYNISIDQAKKLSRLNYMQHQINELPPILQNKFKLLGLKVLVLAPLFKNNDMEGLQDILQSIDDNIKRDTLAKMILALEEKRKHIEESKIQIDRNIGILESAEEGINRTIEELHFTEAKLGEIFQFLTAASPESKDFLMDHLGVKEGTIVLAKRLYYSWQQELKRNNIIEYDWFTYSWPVKDIDKLIAATEKKISNKRSRKCMYFDSKSDPWNSSGEYKKVAGVDTNLKMLFKENKNEINILNKKRKELLKSIHDIKSKSSMSYMEAAILSNQLSSKDIETHALLQDYGMKWLFEQGYICATEISTSLYRFDVIGYNNNNVVTIIEAKASHVDFQRDTKWFNYLKYCNKFYFIFHQYEWSNIKKEALEQAKNNGAGILIVKDSKRVEMIHECSYKNEVILELENLKFNIARTCSKKIIYGY
ncbi:MmcB family DNA repair protein [Clostridium sp. DSM 17811]|uniref:MmcB family DNA repair protein n=1 Tax=Clostridium sp. DSM 17811 TaxID=2843317 RepID=UPI001C0D5ECE|nr:MmcB family DNA repair protein [Clostridium sp. DSM 17811]MBU3102309.1 MmcB family DNA repair protein [Clostridium sp. DSM 17811]